MKRLILVVILILGFCVPVFASPYEDWLSTCKDYKDVEKWMRNNWIYDTYKLKYVLTMAASVKRVEDLKLEVMSPSDTFKEKKGVCYDASAFKKDALNKINPNYKAEIIFLRSPTKIDHFVCGFYLDNKLWVLDYGNTASNLARGTWGPFVNLDQYVKTVYCPKSGKTFGTILTKYYFGWPKQVYYMKW
jgi:hypothetical protein